MRYLMRPAVGLAIFVLLFFGLAAPAMADGPLPHTGRVLVSVGAGDVTVPAGDHVDVVVVVQGDATIRGEVNDVVVVEGSARLEGATVETIVAVRGTVAIDGASKVLADIRTLEATIDAAPGADLMGTTRDLASDLTGIGLFIGQALLLVAIGFALAALLAALLLVAVGERQVRASGEIIRREPLTAFLVGLFGLVVTPIAAVLAMVTIVGLPIGLALLFAVWPAAAFIGYLVATIFAGDWLVTRLRGTPSTGRPYAGAIVGVIVFAVLGLVPFVTAIVTVFGFGAVVVLAWRAMRGDGARLVTTPARFGAPTPA